MSTTHTIGNWGWKQSNDVFAMSDLTVVATAMLGKQNTILLNWSGRLPSTELRHKFQCEPAK